MTTLYPWQEDTLSRNPQHRLIAYPTGLGKSLVLKELVKRNALSVLCICPKSLKFKWEKEILETGVLSKVITRDELKKQYDTLPYFDAVVIDEVSYGFHGKSAMHKALIAYLKKHNPEYVWTADATPYRSDPINLLHAGIILGYAPLTYPQFVARFYTDKYIGKKPVKVPLLKHDNPEVRRKAQIDANEYLSNFSDIVQRPSSGHLSHETVELALTKEQNVWIDRLNKYIDNQSTKYTFINMVENGWVSDKTELCEGEHVNSDKIERIIELAESNRYMLVFAKYKPQQKQIALALKKKYKDAWIEVLNGDNSSDSVALSKVLNDAMVNNDDKIHVLIASTQVAAGWECPDITLAVFASLDYSYVNNTQSLGRCDRENNIKNTTFMYLLSGEIDMRVYEAFQNGTDFDPCKVA